MARRSSNRGSDGNGDKTDETPIEDVSSEAVDAAETTEDAPKSEDDAKSEATEAAGAADEPTDEGVTADADDLGKAENVEDAEVVSDDAATPDDADGTTDGDSETDASDADADGSDEPEPAVDAEPELSTTAEPEPRTIVRERGPGFVPLVLGGVVAAGLGYLATSSGILPGSEPPGLPPEIETQLAEQADALAALQDQIAALSEVEAPEVDLSGIEGSLEALGTQIEETVSAVSGLTDRVVTLEERPVFTGDVTADTAEAAEAIAALEEQMRQREEQAEARAAEVEANARAAEAAAAAAQAEAEAAMAAAEAEAAAAAAEAEAEAALAALRLAITRGEAFADPLADVAEVAEVPEALQTRAGAGVPSLEALQDSFPAAARAALPVALREVAGDNPVDRFSAFIQGQIGGRAIEPREGDSPDAIMSRAQGHVTNGDLSAALAEIATLPEGAQAEMADWITDAQARADVMSALDTVTQTLSGGN